MYRNSRKETPVWQVKNKWMVWMSYSTIPSLIVIHIIAQNSFLTRVLVHWWKTQIILSLKACCNAFFPASARVHIAQVIFILSCLQTEQMETYLMRRQIFDLTCIHYNDLPCKGNIFLGNPEPCRRGGKLWLWKEGSVTALN